MKGPPFRTVPSESWLAAAQVAEQVKVGLVLVPLKLAWKPKEVLPPTAIAPL